MKTCFRNAILADVQEMTELEKSVWGENGADQDKLHSRIKTFPDGNILAIRNDAIVGYVAFQSVEDVRDISCFTWDEICDCGTIEKSHRPKGEYVYGINLTVHQTAQGLKLGNALVLYGLSVVVASNKKGAFIGSRMPGYERFHRKHPEVSAQDYAALRRKGKLRDPELCLYEAEGFTVQKILPGYFPDPPSLNYGVLVYSPNKYYGNIFRLFISWVMKIIAICMIKKTREN